MKITDELIEYLEELGRIRLTDEQKEKAKEDLGAILNYVNKLNELDTAGIEPLSHAFPYTNVFREDQVISGDQRDRVLQNAPEKKDGCYKVPKTVE